MTLCAFRKQCSNRLQCFNIVDCGKPSEPSHSHVNLTNSTRIGAMVTFYCDDGYTLQGDAVLTCLTNNTWNKPSPTCKIKGKTAR